MLLDCCGREISLMEKEPAACVNLSAILERHPTGLRTQGAPGVPQDPFAPRRGPLDPLQIGKVPYETPMH